MSHIDEGLLHAHLDGALGPDEQARWAEAEAHLEVCPDCRRRLEEAREMRDAAHALLSGAAVPAAAGRPAFDELVAQAEARAGDAGREAGPASGAPEAGADRGGRTAPWWKTPAKLAWAASLLLAVGAGWIGRQLVVDEGGEVALLTTERATDAEPAAGALMRDRAEAPAPAKPEAEAEARTATPPATRADPPMESDRIAEARAREPVPGEGADGRGDADEAQARDDADEARARDDAATDADVGLWLQALVTKAAGARCYTAAAGPDRADPDAEADAGAEADERPAGGAGVRGLRLAADGTARLQLDTGPLVGFWEPAADSLHARVTDGRRWFDLRLADTESGLRGTAAPATGMDEPGRATAADLFAGPVELVERGCPGD